MSFREIDTGGFAAATLRDQPSPQLLWVALTDLVIDARYQRALTGKGRSLIQRIADGWDWSKYQPVLVAATLDGRFAVVDGQHRAHAAALAGLTSIPAMAVPMTPVQQAAAFTAVNTDRIALNRAALFKARLAAGDAAAIAARDAVADAGCVLMTYNPTASARRPGEIFTHALILRMVAEGEAAAVIAGLRAIRASEQGRLSGDNYGEGTRVYDGLVLSAWLPALAGNQRFLTLPLADVFDEIDWDDARASASAWARQRGGTVRGHLVERVTAVLRAALDVARVAA